MPDITDKLDRVTDSTTGRPVVALLASPGKAEGATSININDATNWTTTTAIHFSIYATTTIGGVTVKDATTQTDWKGTLSGTVISNLTITGGSDREYTAGAIVEITPTARWAKDLYDNIIAHANQDGSLKSSAVQTALGLGSGALNAWTPLGYNFSSITDNGNRSYTGVISGQDVTGTLAKGMRLRGSRTTTAPTQCADLESSSSQYFSKSSPAGMTFTDDFGTGAWVKLESYGALGTIASRYNNTSGWLFYVNTDGTVALQGNNASSANFSRVTTYQSIPLGKWVHVSAQLDMSAFTATTTTSYVMIDGVDVPAVVARGGTNPTALVQAGNLEIGALSGGSSPFDGKIAQVWISPIKITQANVRVIRNQGLTSTLVTSLSLASAYSLSGASGLTDLNTTNANNLTANGGATATSNDAPFALGADKAGTSFTAGVEEFGIITDISFSTNSTITWQAPEGCAWPTSGTLSAVYYAHEKVPYGFPAARGKWRLLTKNKTDATQLTPASATWYNLGSVQLNVPVGEWRIGYSVSLGGNKAASTAIDAFASLATANNAKGTDELTSVRYNEGASANQNAITTVTREDDTSLSAATTHYLNGYVAAASMGSVIFYGAFGAGAGTTVWAECSLL